MLTEKQLTFDEIDKDDLVFVEVYRIKNPTEKYLLFSRYGIVAAKNEGSNIGVPPGMEVDTIDINFEIKDGITSSALNLVNRAHFLNSDFPAERGSDRIVVYSDNTGTTRDYSYSRS